MIVEELIELLKVQNPKAKVLSYIDQPEEYGEVEKLEVVTSDNNLRYSKTGFYPEEPTASAPIVVLYGNTCLEREGRSESDE